MFVTFTIVFFASLLLIVWILLLGMVSREDWIAAAKNKVTGHFITIENLLEKDAVNKKELSKYQGISAFVMRMFYGTSPEKKIKKLNRDIINIQRGNIKSVSVFAMPGYVLARRYNFIGKGTIYRKVLAQSFELYGKKYAQNKTMDLLTKLLSYPIIGVAISLMLGAILISAENRVAGLAVILVGSALVLVLVYAMYDELTDSLSKRRYAIRSQLPNVVSKLALLVTSGMIMERAWKETAYSRDGQLYKEMRAASEQLENLVSPEVVYGNFILRCNTKETAKLASTIMQNLSKGNAEIGRVLKDMAKEAWQERRHLAKRNAEKAISKLMIPTMLLFLAILVMLMVPIAMNFSGL